jgi:predicted nucleotidyltransferase
MSQTPLTREQAIERLVQSEPEIRSLGVQRLALFGSVARGNAHPDSDVDLLVQFFPGAKTYERLITFGISSRGRTEHSEGNPLTGLALPLRLRL